MNSRDVNEILTKDGSARVQLYKVLNIQFAYTMEIGYHGCPIKNRNPENNCFLNDYQRSSKIFTIEDYQEHGKSIMVSLWKMFTLNTNKGSRHEYGKILKQIREDVCRELV